MGKKKPFIDKKKASTYTLLHRSQRDVGEDILHQNDEGGTLISQTPMVLWPGPNNNRDTDRAVLFGSQSEEGVSKMNEWREKLAQVGLLDETERYLKPITGAGTFLDATGRVANPFAGMPSTTAPTAGEESLMEITRQLDCIPLTPDVMDEEIAAALFDYDEGDFEELNDDFCLMAAQEPEADDTDGKDGAANFDFDEHIRQLMEKARRERELTVQPGETEHDWGRRDNAFFSKLKLLREDDDEDSLFDHATTANTPGVVPKLSPDEERALCEKFEETLAEYDSDEVGDCPDEEIRGTRQLEGDAQLEAALDDFLYEKEDDVFIYGNRHYAIRTGGSGFTVLDGGKMVNQKDLNGQTIEDQPLEPVEVTLAQAKAFLSRPPVQPPPEEILIDGKSYFSERVRNPWDCESILSTYSTLDNNPVTIEAGGRRKKKKKNVTADADCESLPSVQPIHLSNKTGLPLGVLPSRSDNSNYNNGEDTILSVNKGEARKKKETAEEKRARKFAVKQERVLSRIQKKATRDVFQEEFQKRVAVSDDIAGKSVFRFS